MGKKREKKNKAKESSKVQDQKMANAFQHEIALQVQEGNEEPFEEPSSVLEDGKKVSKEMKRSNYKALLEFRCRVEDSILSNYLLGKPSSEEESTEAIQQLKEIKLWGVPLLPSKQHEGTNIVLLKFLKAKDYRVHEAFEMLQKTLKWRKEFNADEILDENLGLDFDSVAYLKSRDKEGHPLYYNIYGALKDKQVQCKILGSEEKHQKYLRWRVQYMEKAIRELEFEAGGTNSIVQIIDLKQSSAPSTKEFRSICRKSWKLLQNNYPQLIHQNIIINVPLWFYISHVFSSRLKAQRKNSRVVIARPGKVTSTLLKFIPAENLPVEYGGLRREDDDDEFSSKDKALVVKAKANSTELIQIPTPEVGVTMVWDLTVVGSWDVSYKEEFIPDDEGSYRVLIQNENHTKKGGSVRNSFYISEPGKIVISIGNLLLKKKKVLYRYKAKPTVPMYVRIKK
ncbi:Sec14p-like phosphatidylinositol transfer family protein, putative isoform 2 [Hibiscus syriacus]|uniref:Sec14p-like phosphatidylinositol transfer family protein, putative isoform 2 n=1 Tax=Hibiscus syriacus TaxID=106335 RepID=A0A6A2YIF9_HIBSY|nr:patellin-4-like [Hibiscus syriacus]KAE8676237.1 Sec14p-like phosphatidylinositol transfer family protein, putative isoform 2 [Hibiscus syriacus]